MNFSDKEDIEAPADEVFAAISDFKGFERIALRRGITVYRTDTHSFQTTGMSWLAHAKFRGRMRSFDVELVQYDSPHTLWLEAKSGGLISMLKVELMPLSRQRTRLSVELDVKPRTLSARLLIQSAKLAKGSLNKRFKDRVARFAQGIESNRPR